MEPSEWEQLVATSVSQPFSPQTAPMTDHRASTQHTVHAHTRTGQADRQTDHWSVNGKG